MRRTVRRSLATTAALVLTAVTAGCGTDEAAEDDSSTGGSAGTTDVIDDAGVAVDSMVGLEVTAVGNVSERLSDEALRLDRDGLGNAEDQGEVGTPQERWDYDYDYDYYEYGDLTEYDEDFGDDDVADEGVLVVSAAGVQKHAIDDAVRVSGTLRRFDQDTIESLYEINLEDDVFDGYEDALVIVADSVRAASDPAAADGSGKRGQKPGSSRSS